MLRLGLASLLVAGCSLPAGGLWTDGGRDGGRVDGATPDAGGDGGVDASPDAGCEEDACSDGVLCTHDVCNTAGVCQHLPDDAQCVAAPLGRCDRMLGCQYPECTGDTCMPDDGCQMAVCEGDTCIRTSFCVPGQQCCGTSCVAPGCDDANPCTDDACVGESCVSLPNTAPCDDGLFCTGVDTCGGGYCGHGGDPCITMALPTMCDEATRACVECTDRAHCPAMDDPMWSPCVFDDACDEIGVEARTVTDYECRAGRCNPLPTMETRECYRSTEGLECGCSAWSGCMYTDLCDEAAPQESRTCRYCTGGTCAGTRTEAQDCFRDTDDMPCRDDGLICTRDVCRAEVCEHRCRPSCTCTPGVCLCGGS